MAWRETRGAWRHFVVFLGCVALGVAALVSVGTFAANLDRTLAREARALTGGDLELRSTYPLAADALAALERLRGAGAVTTTVRELVGMARDPVRGGTLLVELKAVEPAYPLYGRLQTTPAVPLGGLLAARGGADGAVVESQLLERLGLAGGDAFVVGNARYTVTGVLVGGVGIASSVTTFLRRQLATIVILKCLGAGSRVLLAAYLVQTQAVGALGSLVGAGLGVAIQPVLVRALAPFAPFPLEAQWD